MAALEQIDALRKQNRDLLNKLKKQTEKLHQLILSCPYEEDKSRSFSFFETNKVQPPRAGRASPNFTTPTTTETTIRLSEEDFPGDHENPTLEQHEPKHKLNSELTAFSTLLQDAGNSRGTGQSRSERPCTAHSDQGLNRETDSVTTVEPEEDTTSDKRIQPLLGYDWIAGLLDAESSLADRSEQFFSDLHSFRQLNRDQCVHSLLAGLPSVADLASSSLDGDEPQPPADTHQCTFCYRINSRLFAVPLDAQAACPVCKTPKPEHPHTETKPALIRVSIPRSTLLPAYKYKAHRRGSFDPSDSLGLPSHCLSGWSNPTLNSGSQVNGLDLRGSVKKPAGTGGSSSCWSDNKINQPRQYTDSHLPSASRSQVSDQLQNMRRLPRYNFQHTDPKRPEPHSCSHAYC